MRAIAALLLGVIATGAAAQSAGSVELGGLQCAAAEGDAQPWANKSYAPECRARLALAEFNTLDEKLRFLSPPPPKEKSTVRDVAKVLHLPVINGSDGPAGLVRGSATALPSPLAVAASFDPAMATKYGTVLAEESEPGGAKPRSSARPSTLRAPGTSGASARAWARTRSSPPRWPDRKSAPSAIMA